MKAKSVVLFGIMFGLLCGTHIAWSRTMHVQVREGELRARPSFLGAVVTTVQYGDTVEILATHGVWKQVRRESTEGWMHESALTQRRIDWQAGDRELTGATTQDEMALAGRGFNAQVEQQFRTEHSRIDFSWVDRMAKLRKSPQEILEFLTVGGLNVEE